LDTGFSGEILLRSGYKIHDGKKISGNINIVDAGSVPFFIADKVCLIGGKDVRLIKKNIRCGIYKGEGFLDKEMRNVKADGVIGLNAIESDKILIDFEGMKLHIDYEMNKDILVGCKMSVVSYDLVEKRILVSGKNKNQEINDILIDTGSLYTLLPISFADKIKEYKINIALVSGVEEGNLCFSNSVTMGGVNFKNIAFCSGGREIIGMDILKRSKIYIDNTNKK